MHYAAGLSNIDMVQILLDKGADPDLKNFKVSKSFKNFGSGTLYGHKPTQFDVWQMHVDMHALSLLCGACLA